MYEEYPRERQEKRKSKGTEGGISRLARIEETCPPSVRGRRGLSDLQISEATLTGIRNSRDRRENRGRTPSTDSFRCSSANEASRDIVKTSIAFSPTFTLRSGFYFIFVSSPNRDLQLSFSPDFSVEFSGIFLNISKSISLIMSRFIR